MNRNERETIENEWRRFSIGDSAIARRLARLRSRFASPPAAVALALATVGVGLAIRWSLADPEPRFVILYPAVALSALIGGPLAGVVATVVAAIGFDLLFIEPVSSFWIADAADLLSVANFVATGLMISLVSAVDQTTATSILRLSRENEDEKARHRTTVDALNEGIVVFDLDGTPVSANAAAEHLLGLDLAALRRLYPRFSDWNLIGEDGEPLPFEDFQIHRTLRDGTPSHGLVAGIRRDETTLWVLYNIAPLREAGSDRMTAVVISFSDITERRRIAHELLQSRARLASVLEALHEGVMVFDPSGRCLSCNRSAEKILRRSAAEMVGGPSFLALGRKAIREDGSDFPIEDRPIRRALRTGVAARDIVAGIHDESGLFWILLNVEPVFEPGTDRVRAAVASFTDITRRRETAAELAENRARLESIFAAVHEGIVVFSADGTVSSWNPSAERALRIDGGGKPAFDAFFGETPFQKEDGGIWSRDSLPATFTLRTGRSVHGAIVGFTRAGALYWTLVNSEPIFEPGTDTVRAVVVSLNDVTDWLRAKRQLTDSHARFSSIVASAMDAIVSVDSDQRIVLFNDAAERMFGIPATKALGRPLETFIPDRHREGHRVGFSAFAAEGATTRVMGRGLRLLAKRADGSEFPIEASISRVVVDGKPLYTVIHRDISEQVAADRANAQLAAIVRSSPDAILTISLEGRIETWNAAATRMFGYLPEQAVGAPISLLSPIDGPNTSWEIFRRVSAGEAVKVEALRRRADGTTMEVLSSAAPIRDATGRVVAGVAILSDISQLRRRERQLVEREDGWRKTLQAAGLGVFWIEASTGLVHCDERSRELLGAQETEPAAAIAERLHADDRDAFLALRDRLDPSTAHPLTLRRMPQGAATPIWLSLTARLRLEDERGEEIWGTVLDVTEAQRAEEATRRYEAARRLEALGRMTGGIAHDLNNLLTIVSGNLQLLEMSPNATNAERWITEALTACERGSAFNNRLLTFARRRHLVASLADLNELVRSMADLLRRTVGSGIEIVTRFAPDLGLVRIDASEIENAILNLVLNARDAMPKGGRVLIETRNVLLDETSAAPDDDVRPGPYVRLEVSDDGNGMTPEVKARAFEPFYTTKETGRGSGLGLATLHGFVRQSGGWVTLYSELGKGTSIGIYLPRADQVDGEEAIVDQRRPIRGSGETILLVEDDPAVGRVTRERLEALGYRVVVASNSAEAMAAMAGGETVDLVFTDIVMPGGTSGLELAQRIRAEAPHRRILVTSGFAEEFSGAPVAAEIGFPFLRKPYSLYELSAAVSGALDTSDDADPSI
jgi:PAS domain S-box-containing protein